MRKYRAHGEYLDNVLQDPKEAARYLNAAVEENDSALLLSALAQVVRALGISGMARRVSLSRAGLYKIVSKNGNPELRTFIGILSAAGLQMHFRAIHQRGRR